jgi:hypothetical protein
MPRVIPCAHRAKVERGFPFKSQAPDALSLEQEDDVSERELRTATVRVLRADEGSGAFYAPAKAPAAAATTDDTEKREGKPAHYKVICISMYMDDLKRLDGMVESLKARGLTKANRSALIRYALSGVNLETVPKGL